VIAKKNYVISFKDLLVYGTSILQYNIDKKMQFAMQLLLNNMQIKHIAFEVGYDNHSKFSAAFRKNTKTTFRYPT
jgi:AraC-like DNA-binding protein